jgi:hypothetical protein
MAPIRDVGSFEPRTSITPVSYVSPVRDTVSDASGVIRHLVGLPLPLLNGLVVSR